MVRSYICSMGFFLVLFKRSFIRARDVLLTRRRLSPGPAAGQTLFPFIYLFFGVVHFYITQWKSMQKILDQITEKKRKQKIKVSPLVRFKRNTAQCQYCRRLIDIYTQTRSYESIFRFITESWCTVLCWLSVFVVTGIILTVWEICLRDLRGSLLHPAKK